MITYHLSRLADGRILFAPGKEPSHTFPDETAARWFVRGWHYRIHTYMTEFTVEIE